MHIIFVSEFCVVIELKKKCANIFLHRKDNICGFWLITVTTVRALSKTGNNLFERNRSTADIDDGCKMLFRRTSIVVAMAASKNIGPAGRDGRRTVVRDPRKAKKKKATRTTPISPRTATTTASSVPAQQHHHPHHDHIHNDPTLHNKMKLPSPLFPVMTHTTTNLHADPAASRTTSATLVTYMVAGSGVALGVTLVGVILKGLGL